MFGGAIGGMFSGGVGSIVGGMFGGPLGAMAGNMLQNIASQVIDQAIEDLPLPQPLKDAMQASFHGALGNYQEAGQNLNEMLSGLSQLMSPMEFASLEGAINDLKQAVEELGDAYQCNPGDGSTSTGGPDSDSWLIAIAKALGDQLNDKAEDLENKANKLNEEGSKPKDTAVFQASAKEFQMAFEAATTAIKTIGDALNSAARKQ